MDEGEYDRICSLDVFPHADGASGSPTLSVSEETFAVIKRQQQHRRFRAALRTHRHEKALAKYVARHGRGESIAEIAAAVDFSPCMMVRVLLEAEHGWSKTSISNVFKEAMADEDDDRGEESEPTNCRGLSETEYARVLREVRL